MHSCNFCFWKPTISKQTYILGEHFALFEAARSTKSQHPKPLSHSRLGYNVSFPLYPAPSTLQPPKLVSHLRLWKHVGAVSHLLVKGRGQAASSAPKNGRMLLFTGAGCMPHDLIVSWKGSVVSLHENGCACFHLRMLNFGPHNLIAFVSHVVLVVKLLDPALVFKQSPGRGLGLLGLGFCRI